MTEHLILVPDLTCSAAPLRHADIPVADRTVADSMAGIGRAILTAAPPRFALVGLSMGGYIAFEIMQQPPDQCPEHGAIARRVHTRATERAVRDERIEHARILQELHLERRLSERRQRRIAFQKLPLPVEIGKIEVQRSIVALGFGPSVCT